MSQHAKPTYPSLSDVPDIEHDPAFPVGFESEPDANDAAMLSGALSVLAFCFTHKWPDVTQRKVARAFASHGPSAKAQWRKGIEAAYPDRAVNAGLNLGTAAERFEKALSGSLPAWDANSNPVKGANALSETCTDPKADYFAMLLFDLEHSAIEGSTGAVA